MRINSRVRSAFGGIFLLISLAGLFNFLKFTKGSDIWYDEVFSLMFIRGNYSEIIASTARDVHPPLYYIYLKAFTALFTKLSGVKSFFFAAKLASVFPWLVLFIVDITYIRKRFGLFAAGFFAALISFMPQLPVFFLEIRMYSLALLLVTLHVLVAERIIDSGKKTVYYHWILFFFLGIATAYTQYYACIATIGIYFATLVILIADRKNPENKKKTAWVLFAAILSYIFYIPWIPVLLKQMGNISGSYWIQPLTLRSLAGCVKFVVLPEGNTSKLAYISVGLMLVSIAAAFIIALRSERKEILKALVLLLSPAVMVVISGFVLSALGTPIFVYRYLIPALGAFWLFVAVIFDKSFCRAPVALLIIPFILIGVMNIRGFNAEEQKKLDQEETAFAAVSELPENSVIITNFDHVTAVISYYRPDCRVYLYEAPIDRLLSDGLGNITELIKDEDVKELVSSNPSVYFLGSFNSREEIVENWKSLGISNELLNNILIERYWINTYRLF